MLGRLMAILGFISSVPVWILSVILAIFLSLSDLGKDLLCFLLDEALTLVEYILNSVPADFTQFDPTQYFAGLPSELINAASYIHLPQALAIIVSALVVRFFLQLIPFVRLGS
jgi:hypothetical protein